MQKKSLSMPMNVLVIGLLLVIIVLLGVSLTSNHDNNGATNTNAAQQASPSQTSQLLQSCVNQAHQQWDGVIATAEGTPGNAYDFDKSQLDQRLVECHQQYGY